MASFLKGTFKGFYKAGTSECVRDVWRFTPASSGKINFQVTRRDMESQFGRFWRYEMASLNMIPVDPSQPRLGGKVTGQSWVLDVRALTIGRVDYAGVYGEDFVTFGQFAPGYKHAVDDEELLL
jgi:hypothetical protein